MICCVACTGAIVGTLTRQAQHPRSTFVNTSATVPSASGEPWVNGSAGVCIYVSSK